MRLRRGLRGAIAVAAAMTLVLGLATSGGAQSTDDPPPPTPPVISIADATAAVTEGQSASFPVTLDQPAVSDFTVTFTTSEGLTGSFDVKTGDTSETAMVPTAANDSPENDRTFTVTLDAPDPSNATLGTATATGSIVDDDWEIQSVTTTPDPPSAAETGSKTIDFTATLNAGAAPAAAHPITVDYAVSDGSAVNGQNYTVTQPANGHTSGTLTFAPGGSNSVRVQITSKDDGLYGSNRTFTVTFSNPHGASFASGANEQATGTITEGDAPPQLGISDCTGSPINAGGVANFLILLGGAHPATTVAASVDYTTVGDSTVAGDFDAMSGTATIPAGQREFDLKVPTHVAGPVGDRSFHVQLSNPQNVSLTNSSAGCTIHNTTGSGGGGGGGNKGSITIADPAPVSEPTSGTVPVSVKLTLTPPQPQPANPGPVAVHWQTQDGTAKAGADYTAASGDVTWPAGMYGPNPTAITIPITPNPATTTPVSFQVAFTSSDATFVGAATATVTIVPAGSTVPLLSIGDASVASKSGSVPVVVTMKPAAAGAVTVAYGTADGTDANAAKAGTNYTATSGTLTFAPGATSQTINIPIAAVQSSGPNRDFAVNLSSPTGGSTIAVGSATVTILNDFAVVVTPPVLKPTSSGPQQKPQPQVVTQGPIKGTHFVLVQMLTGTGHVSSKGLAAFKIGCPSIVIRKCVGTAVFEIGMKVKVKKKTVIKAVRVASGSYSVPFGKSGTFNAKVTAQGLKLLAAVKRMKTKATLSSHDPSGAKGVTAWLVSLQAPAAPAKKTPAKKTPAKKK